ncbi:efflux RND transporter periplasmic adaptor subunit [Phascolarctobacterium succinatutens]|uniref:efflux RND transporter periplasmic adaptor subunit n=1 Tax=Phascolarctobacterium succinatutens TaxID=626940 RepID=UPI003A8D200F
MYKSINLFGQLKAKAQIDIVNKYAGIVDEINVDLGSKVQAGDILLVQHLDDARAEMLKAKARYAEAGANAATTDVSYNTSLIRYEADYKLAQVNAERYRKLYAQGAVSKSELDSMEQTLANKKAQYDALAQQESYDGTPSQVYRQEQIAARREQEYIIAQNKYHDLIFKAPRAGIITYRDAEVGGYAPAGSRLLTLLDDSGFTVDCDITEAEAASVTVGTHVELKLEAIGEICRGTVVYVSPVRSRETNKFTLRIRLDEPGSNVKAGLFAKGELRFLQKPSTIYLPKNAVLERDGKYFVYVLGKGNKALKKPVTTGASNNESIEIVQGVKVGETVILDNLARLRDGMVVEVAKEEAK